MDSWVRKIPWRRDRLPTPVFFGFPCGSAGKESACNVGELGSIPQLGRSPWRRERLPTPVFWPGEFHELYSPWGCKEWDMTERLSLSLQVALVVKNLPANAGDGRDAGSISESGRCPGAGHGNPLQYSCLENPMDRRAQQATSIGSQSVEQD